MTMSADATEGRGRRDESRWLPLAAAPTFALMAAGTALEPSPLTLCTSGFLPLDGMVTMYLLMSLFHLPPWLKLASARWTERL